MLRSEPAKSGASVADLDLLDDRLPVAVHEFDGIFDGHHVIVAIRVDQVDQRGQRRAFAAAGGSGDQHQSLTRLGESTKRRRQVQRFERRDFFGQQADAAGHGAALVMDIRAKTSDALAAEAQIHGLGALQFAALRLRKQGQQKIASFLCGQGRASGGATSAPAIRNVTGAPAISSRSDAARRTACASNWSSELELGRNGVCCPRLRAVIRVCRAVQLGDNLRKFVRVIGHVISMIHS